MGKPGQSGIGGILRSHLGSLMCLFSCPIGIADSNEAKLRAILQAIRITSQQTTLLHTALGIIIESDSRTAISWASGSSQPPWILNGFVNTIRTIMNFIPPISFLYTPREGNSVADQLAKQGVVRHEDFIAHL